MLQQLIWLFCHSLMTENYSQITMCLVGHVLVQLECSGQLSPAQPHSEAKTDMGMGG